MESLNSWMVCLVDMYSVQISDSKEFHENMERVGEGSVGVLCGN